MKSKPFDGRYYLRYVDTGNARISALDAGSFTILNATLGYEEYDETCADFFAHIAVNDVKSVTIDRCLYDMKIYPISVGDSIFEVAPHDYDGLPKNSVLVLTNIPESLRGLFHLSE